MIKIVITGANGFLGSSLAKKIKTIDGMEIVALDIEGDPLFNPDLLKKALTDADYVYHFAGVKDPTSSELVRVNVEGTKNLLNAMVNYCPNARLVFASTFAVYKIPESGQIVTENFVLNPRNLYGESKLSAEKLIEEYSHKYGIKALIMRMSNVYGLDESGLKKSVIVDFINNIKNSRKIMVGGDGSQTRDFVYIDDVIDAMLKAQNVSIMFGIVNIASSEEFSILELISLIENISGLKADIEFTDIGSQGGFWKGNVKHAANILSWFPKTNLRNGIYKILKFKK